MTPLQQLTAFVRDLLAAGSGATPAQIEHLRQLWLHVLDHSTDTDAEMRQALRDVLDTSQRPNAASWKTDSGIGHSRAPY